MTKANQDLGANSTKAAFWKRNRVAAVAITCASVLAAGTANTSEQITLKLAHLFPAKHYLWVQGGEVFAKEVDKATNGKVKFEVYPAKQLGKDNLGLMKSGLADLSILIPSYTADKLPLTSVAELPGLHSTSCEGTEKLWSVIKTGQILNELEYKTQNVHVLFVTVLPPYPVMTTSKTADTLEKLSGMKLRANGAAMDETIRSLGAVPVRIKSPDFYDSLTRGTVDGGVYPYQGLKAYELEKVLKYSTVGPNLGAGSVVYAMSQKAWDKLSPENQKIFDQAAQTAQKSLCQWEDEQNISARDRIVKNNGHTLTKLEPAELERWNEKLRGVAASWAKGMDSAGKAGTEVLKAITK